MQNRERADRRALRDVLGRRGLKPRALVDPDAQGRRGQGQVVVVVPPLDVCRGHKALRNHAPQLHGGGGLDEDVPVPEDLDVWNCSKKECCDTWLD